MQKLLTIILLFISTNIFGQSNCLDSTLIEINKRKSHNFIGFVPSNARTTNGWAIGWSTSVSDYCASMDSIRINGLYTNISPFQVIVASMGVIMGAASLFMPNKYKQNSRDTVSYDILLSNHQLNGMSVGLFEHGEEFTMQGFQMSVVGHKMDKLNGISLTLITSEYKHSNGLMISGIYNKAYKVKGVQIGLINKAKKMKGIQIGLWNKIGDRAYPLINMKFKKID